MRAGAAAAALVIAALAAVLIAAPNALAANDCSAAATDPTAAQYCNPTSNVSSPAGEEEEGSETVAVANEGGDPAGGESVSASSTGGGSLPFTGADLLGLAAVASVLLAVGLALRRLSTANPDAT